MIFDEVLKLLNERLESVMIISNLVSTNHKDMTPQEFEEFEAEMLRQIQQSESLRQETIDTIRRSASNVENAIIVALGMPIPDWMPDLLTDTAASFRHMAESHVDTSNQCFDLIAERGKLFIETSKLRQQIDIRDNIILEYIKAYGDLPPASS